MYSSFGKCSLSLCFELNLSFRVSISVTRFGEISPLWQKFKTFWLSLEGLFSIWQNFKPTLANISSKWQAFIVVNHQKLKNNLSIWSPWFRSDLYSMSSNESPTWRNLVVVEIFLWTTKFFSGKKVNKQKSFESSNNNNNNTMHLSIREKAAITLFSSSILLFTVFVVAIAATTTGKTKSYLAKCPLMPRSKKFYCELKKLFYNCMTLTICYIGIASRSIISNSVTS